MPKFRDDPGSRLDRLIRSVKEPTFSDRVAALLRIF